MQKVLLGLLLLTDALGLAAQSGDDIFTFTSDGTVQSKQAYITTPFYWTGVLKLKDFSTTTFQTKNKDTYTVNLQKNIYEKKPYFFHVLQIKYNNKLIFEVKNEDCWYNAEFTNGSTHQYEVVPLSETASAVLFFGWIYDVTPPLLTIVVVNKGKAKLVFNQNCDIRKFTNTANEFSLIYADQIQEYITPDQPEPADDELPKFKIWKSGNVLKLKKYGKIHCAAQRGMMEFRTGIKFYSPFCNFPA